MLANGDITPDELGRKNTFASATKIIIDLSRTRPLK
jgi:hypothetical protein